MFGAAVLFLISERRVAALESMSLLLLFAVLLPGDAHGVGLRGEDTFHPCGAELEIHHIVFAEQIVHDDFAAVACIGGHDHGAVCRVGRCEIKVGGVDEYDICIKAYEKILDKDWFAYEIIVIFVLLVSFAIGYGAEGVALTILYHVSSILVKYISDKTNRDTLDLASMQDSDTANKVESIIGQEGTLSYDLPEMLENSSSFVLKIALAFAVLFAIVMPVVSSMSFRTSIHRAITIMTVCAPLYIVVSAPLVSSLSIGTASRFGIIFRNAKILNNVKKINSAAIDKPGVLASQYPQLIAVKSSVTDNETFMNFAAHAVYNCDLPFAKAIGEAYSNEYRLSLIGENEEIPGYGAKAVIGGTDVIIARKEYFVSQGIELPFAQIGNDNIYYMTINGRYIGCVYLTDETYETAISLVKDLKASGVKKTVVFTDDVEETAAEFGSRIEADEVYPEFSGEQKTKYLEDLKESYPKDYLGYIFATGIESHSPADMDIAVRKQGNDADVILYPDSVANFPLSFNISGRMDKVISNNALIVMAVKAVLIMLTMLGVTNIWLTAFLDMMAGLASMLLAVRVTDTDKLVNY